MMSIPPIPIQHEHKEGRRYVRHKYHKEMGGKMTFTVFHDYLINDLIFAALDKIPFCIHWKG